MQAGEAQKYFQAEHIAMPHLFQIAIHEEEAAELGGIQYCPPICHSKGKSRRHREIAGLELKKHHKTDHYREFMTKGYMEKIL